MSQPEARLSRAIMAALRARGAFVWKVHGGPMQMAGLPDIVGVWHGRFIGVESKLDTSLSTRQVYVIRRLREAGAVVVVAHSVAEALTGLAAGIGRADVR